MSKMSPWPAKKQNNLHHLAMHDWNTLIPFYVTGNFSKNLDLSLHLCCSKSSSCRSCRWYCGWAIPHGTQKKYIWKRYTNRGHTRQCSSIQIHKNNQSMEKSSNRWRYLFLIEYKMENTNKKWRFIVKFAPWMSGFYERLLGMVNSSLRKTIGSTHLTDTQFTTFKQNQKE